ncbi:MAG TPA: FAD/NAD(P)-binding oxidoreductase [Dehalococcoidia bacterium]|nr:FAD/NAD(P)-binding oxidoreductase [Dehalococcoidia bacterium]
MEGKRILILGGGIGGLATARHLRIALPPEHRIVVVDKGSTLYIRALNMRLISGEMKHPREGERDLSGLESKGIEWIRGEVLEIDQKQKVVQTTAGTLKGDYLVIALGAERVPDAVGGFTQVAYNFYEAYEALKLKEALDEFDSGRIVILVCSAPFSCPAAPYEAALLIDSMFRKKEARQRVEIAIYTPEAQPMASAGPSMGSAVCSMLAERGIEYHPLHKINKIEPDVHRLVFKGSEASFDLLAGVPSHMAPRVVQKAGLTDKTGWIPVDLQTLETRYPGVFAIGDITSIRQPNPTGLFLPKAWVFAEEQSRVVARNIATQILDDGKHSTFRGRGFCYIEVGEGKAAYGSGNFYASPEPLVYLEAASERFHKERRALEQELLETLV